MLKCLNLRSLRLFVLVLSIEIFSTYAYAATYHVGIGGGYTYNDIQSAINTSSNGDTVIVHPGTYTEDVNFLSKDITLTTIDPGSQYYRNQTIISPLTKVDASTNGVFEGFTINGSVKFGANNYPDVRSYSPTIRNNNIVSSSIGIDIMVGYLQPAPTPIIENNIIQAGTGIYMFTQAFAKGLDPVIRHNTIVGTGEQYGIGIQYRTHNEVPVISNNIIMNFNYGIGITYHTLDAERLPIINHNNVYDNLLNYSFGNGDPLDLTGTQGNISADPLFVDIANSDFQLTGNSPMIDKGWDAGLYVDCIANNRPYDVPGVGNEGTDGSDVLYDIGAYEYIPEPIMLSTFAVGAVVLFRRQKLY